MNFKSLDLFSTPFLFYTENQHLKKGTYLGSALSIIVFGLVFSYFVYLTNQYISNQIDPKFRSQSFITEELTSIDLHEDLVGFRFEYQASKSIDQLQAMQNKTYLVYYAVSSYSNKGNLNLTTLDIIECKNPRLAGYNCLDFSNLSNSTLFLSAKDNILNSLLIIVYGCYDLDEIKTVIPDNCASQEEINNIINGNSAGLRLKLYTSQYNTTSLQNQVNFRHIYIPTVTNSFIMQTLNIQKQETSVTQGYILQSKSFYSSPVQYTPQSQIFSQINVTQIEVILQMDEIVQRVSVEYPYFPEILALVNSTFALLMTLGVIGRHFAQKLMLKEFLLLYIQNMYQDVFEQILPKEKLVDVQNTQGLDTLNQIFQEQKLDEKQGLESVAIPTIKPKFKDSIEKSQTIKQQDIILSLNSKCKNNEKTQNSAKHTLESSSIEEYNFSAKEYVSQKNNFSQNKLKQCQDMNSKQILTQFKAKINQRQKYSNQKDFELLNTNNFSSQSSFQNTKNTSIFDQNNILSFDQMNTLKLQQKNNSLQEKQSLSKSQQTQFPFKLEQKNGIQYLKQTNNHQAIQKTDSQNNLSKQNFHRSSFKTFQMPQLVDYLTKKLKAIQDINKLKQVYEKIFRNSISIKSLHPKQIWLKLCGKQKIDILEQVKNTIQQQVIKSLNIFELYKDVILLKKALMVLLSKDQLAAVRLIGYQYDNCNQHDFQNNLIYDDNQKKEKNYFEKQVNILNSDKLQQKYLNKFLKRLHNQTDISELDFRIIQSINKNQLV
ncbi:AMP-binding enzyme family protein (macronuclear) [Tetrahymena thermophila SB210]|uniref:AMP-binding enzyme family protein n=1 Tax=Tetrahymena thermophila (strain SB210) TaxID=312017 RepID=Q23QB7_TETTS|nr:AMP-binding enzyme family protein [Tetrahymena thermophila SB210]EAR98667.2 AMP-binding enzyme family protein [Tetrahymena thermophila SB210]|eukprot:XP_001018912.2 AMP-binding enzyme family protein [Tetrahymena thermophila SB210]